MLLREQRGDLMLSVTAKRSIWYLPDHCKDCRPSPLDLLSVFQDSDKLGLFILSYNI